MSNQFIDITETDYGSKARAKVACQRFPKELTANARWKLVYWWQEVLETARALCPVDTGTLQATGRITETDPSIGGLFEVGMTLENTNIISKMIEFGGLLVNPKSGRICDYAQAVHDGHFTRSGRWMPPNPFIEMAIQIHMQELDTILGKSIDEVANTVWVGE
jgi:hypothetical protein